MNVPCIASDTRTVAFGSAARRIASQEKPRITIAAHMIPNPRITNDGLEVASAETMFPMPIVESAFQTSSARPSITTVNAIRRAAVTSGRRLPTGLGSRLGSRRAGACGRISADLTPTATATRAAEPTGFGVSIASS